MGHALGLLVNFALFYTTCKLWQDEDENFRVAGVLKAIKKESTFMDLYTYKALHLIFMVSWFAGLFYIVRLFIYHTESFTRDPHEGQILRDQFRIM